VHITNGIKSFDIYQARSGMDFTALRLIYNLAWVDENRAVGISGQDVIFQIKLDTAGH
jgi:hypothetical protein